MRLKFGQLHATVLCQYAAFAEVASAALGGGEDAKPARDDITASAANGDQAVAMINNALRFG